MRKFIYQFCYALVCLSICINPVGCSYLTKDAYSIKTAASLANGTILSIEAAQNAAISIYRVKQIETIDNGIRAGKSQKELEAALDAIRLKWEPVWQVFSKIRLAQKSLKLAVKAYQLAESAGDNPSLNDIELYKEELEGLAVNLAETLAEVRGSK